MQRLAAQLLTRVRTAFMPVDIDKIEVSVDIKDGDIPLMMNGNDDKQSNSNENDFKQDFINNKKRGSHIKYSEDNKTANVFMTVSIGISQLKSEKSESFKKNQNDDDMLVLDQSPADWIQRADLSLQRAKKKGKNCIGPLLEHDDRPQDFKNDITSQWFAAASKGEHQRILEMVKTGFSVDTLQTSYDSDTKLTALMTAAIYDHSEVARTLLRYNANINLQDEYGRTSLIHCAQNGSIKTAKVLIENGHTGTC